MTDLTEQWKKGELPCGWYYIKIIDMVFIDFFEGKVWKNKKDEYIDEVLAQVPTFDEWKASYNCMFENEVLRLKNTKLKELLESKTLAKNGDTEIVIEMQSIVKEYAELWYDANRRICMLTELLVEAKECVEENLEFSKSIGRNRIKPRNKGLLKRIEKALKD